MKIISCIGASDVSLYNMADGGAGVRQHDSKVMIERKGKTLQEEVLAIAFTDMSKGRHDISLSLVVGNIYSIQSTQARISKDGQKLIKDVRVGLQKVDDSLETKVQLDKEDYKVTGFKEEDAIMTESNLRLLPVDSSLDNIESRMTSVSQGTISKSKPGASLTVVLKQAL